MSPELAGGFFTIEPPGKLSILFLKILFPLSFDIYMFFIFHKMILKSGSLQFLRNVFLRLFFKNGFRFTAKSRG